MQYVYIEVSLGKTELEKRSSCLVLHICEHLHLPAVVRRGTLGYMHASTCKNVCTCAAYVISRWLICSERFFTVAQWNDKRFSRQEHWRGCHAPPLGILPARGSSLHLLCSCVGRQVLYHWHHLGSLCWSTVLSVKNCSFANNFFLMMQFVRQSC